MPIKILHLITDLNVGGAEMSLTRLLVGMDRSEFDAQVVSLVPAGPLGERISALGIPVRSLGMAPGRPQLAALLRLVRWLRSDPPDILQTWLYHADLLGILAARLAGIRAVLWNLRNSEMDLSQYRRLSSVVLRLCAWFSGWPQLVISNSRAGQAFHAGIGYHPIRWEVIPNGIDTEEFKPDPTARDAVRRALKLDLDIPLIGQVARYDPMKGQELFLGAAGRLVRRGSDAHFVMVGHGVAPDNAVLADIIERERLTERVHLLGRMENIAHWSAALDILTSASSGEGFPNAVAEAMACGVPCVVTDVGDSALLVGDSGIVVPPRSLDSLAAAWEHLLSLPDVERREMGLRARQRILDSFSIGDMVRSYARVHRDIIAAVEAKS